MSNNKICCTCSQPYQYCGHCDSNRKINRWRNNYCSENCRDIFKTVTDYIGKLITIKEAKERLSKCNLNIKATEQLNKYIVEILAYKEPKKTVTKTVDEENTTSVEEEKPKRRRRRRVQKTEE